MVATADVATHEGVFLWNAPLSNCQGDLAQSRLAPWTCWAVVSVEPWAEIFLTGSACMDSKGSSNSSSMQKAFPERKVFF